MSLQSITNTLSAQQILQLLQQQQQTASADTDATGAPATDAANAGGQNVPTGTNSQDAGGGAAVAAPTTLDPATIKALLQIQEMQTQDANDTLLFGSLDGTGTTTGDPLLDALSSTGTTGIDGTSDGVDGTTDSDPMDSLFAELGSSASNFSSEELAGADPAQLQSEIAAMTGSAASGNSIDSTTQEILGMLNGDTTTNTDAFGLPTAPATGATGSTDPLAGLSGDSGLSSQDITDLLGSLGTTNTAAGSDATAQQQQNDPFTTSGIASSTAVEE